VATVMLQPAVIGPTTTYHIRDGGWLKGQGWWVGEEADAAPINLLTCILEIHFNYNIFI
jgi:hypothetical protein